MPWKRNTPGCASCNCVAYLFGDGSASSPIYLDSRPGLPFWESPKPLAEFPLAEGAIVAGAYTLTNGQRLAPRSSLLGCATAWSHEIDIVGDADLEWDGLTIQLRATAGTVTVGGHTAAFMPTDATTRKVRLILYVTPAWLMVAAIRYHIAPDEYTGNNRTTTTRSAVQVINRNNNFRDRVPVLTSVGTSTILAWFAADATVSLDSGGYLGGYLAAITRDCYRPQLPEGLESNYQKQNEATTTYLGRTHPATFSIVGDPEAAAEIDYTYNDGSGPVTLRWSLDAIVAAGLVRLVGVNTANFVWSSSTWGAFSNTITGSLGPPVGGGLGTSSFVVRSETLTCCPSSPTSGPMGSHVATARVDAATKAFWAAPTGANPYPKPAYRHALTVTQYTAAGAILSQSTTFATVTPSPTSTAAATLITSTITDPITGTGNIRFSSLDVQWVTS